MKIRNVIISLATLLSINQNNVNAVEPQDSTRISSDTLKVCILDNPVFGPGVYFDFPNQRWLSTPIKRPGNYWETIVPGWYALISDGTFMGHYLSERLVPDNSPILISYLTDAFNAQPNRTFSLTLKVPADETDLTEFLGGYLGK